MSKEQDERLKRCRPGKELDEFIKELEARFDAQWQAFEKMAPEEKEPIRERWRIKHERAVLDTDTHDWWDIKPLFKQGLSPRAIQRKYREDQERGWAKYDAETGLPPIKNGKKGKYGMSLKRIAWLVKQAEEKRWDSETRAWVSTRVN